MLLLCRWSNVIACFSPVLLSPPHSRRKTRIEARHAAAAAMQSMGGEEEEGHGAAAPVERKGRGGRSCGEEGEQRRWNKGQEERTNSRWGREATKLCKQATASCDRKATTVLMPHLGFHKLGVFPCETKLQLQMF
ncbi:hypothetical protein GW17_00005144 [Ensete ventricosum]|nr:hypothetical protein GW17_00005144 [Ensete ventricosum]